MIESSLFEAKMVELENVIYYLKEFTRSSHQANFSINHNGDSNNFSLDLRKLIIEKLLGFKESELNIVQLKRVDNFIMFEEKRLNIIIQKKPLNNEGYKSVDPGI